MGLLAWWDYSWASSVEAVIQHVVIPRNLSVFTVFSSDGGDRYSFFSSTGERSVDSIHGIQPLTAPVFFFLFSVLCFCLFLVLVHPSSIWRIRLRVVMRGKKMKKLYSHKCRTEIVFFWCSGRSCPGVGAVLVSTRSLSLSFFGMYVCGRSCGQCGERVKLSTYLRRLCM